jgi:hypothetical protein
VRSYNKRVLKKIARERVRRLHRCHKCFTPWMLPVLFRWDDGGVVTLRFFNRNMRFAFIENDLLSEILELMVGHFGEEEVYEIARNVQRGSTSAYTAMLFAADQWWLKPFSFAARYSFVMPRMLEMSIALLGYSAGKAADLRMPNAAVYTRNPYNLALLSADIEGVYLVVREREVNAEIDPISEEEGVYMYYAEVPEKRTPGIYRQYAVDTPPIAHVPEPYGLDRCPRCGVPNQITRFWWDPRGGIIVHKDTGKRMIVWPCYAVERLMGTFVEQLGKEAETLIFNTVKGYQRNNITSGGMGLTPEEKLEFLESSRKGQYMVLLRHLASLGYGHGEVEIEEAARIKITMTNPLLPLVAAGLMAGMAEALEGRPVTASWEESPDTTNFILEL